jgi:acyl carrier protein
MNTTRASIPNPAEASTDHHVDPPATERRLRRVVAEMLGTSDGEIAASITLVDDLAVDSLDLLELAL